MVLAEDPVSSVKLVKALNEDSADYFLNHPNLLCQKVTILSKFHYGLIRPVEENQHWTTRIIQAVEGEEFLLTALHLVNYDGPAFLYHPLSSPEWLLT